MKSLIFALTLATLVASQSQADDAIPEWVNSGTLSKKVKISYQNGSTESVNQLLDLREGDQIVSLVIIAASKRSTGQIKVFFNNESILDQRVYGPDLETIQIPIQDSLRSSDQISFDIGGTVYVDSIIAVISKDSLWQRSEDGRKQREEQERQRREEEKRKREAEERERQEAERRAKLRCIDSNVFGQYAAGGGCNAFGCYWPNGGCNAFGCYYEGGDCGAFGCTKEAAKTKRACY